MNLLGVLKAPTIACGADIEDKDALLHSVAGLAAGCPEMQESSVSDIYDALKAREALGSTGFGNGVAIPHCRLPGVDGFVAGLITVPAGLDFDSLDGKKAYLFPFVVGPENRPKEHLNLLSHISQSLRDSEMRKSLLSADTPKKVIELLKESIDPGSSTPPHRPGMKMLQVFIRNENLFDEILQVFTTGTSSAVVVETHESTEYISSIPFFAGFWSTDIRQFNRVILAVIRDELVNSTVRRIEYICGKLSDRDDIMVTVTDLHYVLGSLDN